MVMQRVLINTYQGQNALSHAMEASKRATDAVESKMEDFHNQRRSDIQVSARNLIFRPS